MPYASIAPPPLLQDNAECVHMLQGRLFPLLTEICLLDHAALHKDGGDPALAGVDASALAPTDVKFCESAHASEAGGPLLLQPYQVRVRVRVRVGVGVRVRVRV